MTMSNAFICATSFHQCYSGFTCVGFGKQNPDDKIPNFRSISEAEDAGWRHEMHVGWYCPGCVKNRSIKA